MSLLESSIKETGPRRPRRGSRLPPDFGRLLFRTIQDHPTVSQKPDDSHPFYLNIPSFHQLAP